MRETRPGGEYQTPGSTWRTSPGGTDFISDLPDGLIAAILAHLPAMDAIKTSVLSRRWRPLWKFIPDLNFYPTSAQALTPADVVDHVLQQHHGHLHHCGIALEPLTKFFPHLGAWVACLAVKRIRSLELHIGELSRQLPPSTLPSGAFSATKASLRRLSLCSFDLPDPNFLMGCSNLTSLRLSEISSMRNATVAGILSNCPRLEELSLSACSLTRLEVRSPTLLHLALSRLPKLLAVIINAPALVTLTMSGMIWYKDGIKLRVPRLTALYTFEPEREDGDSSWHTRAATGNKRCTEELACRCSKDVLEYFSNIKDLPNFDVCASPLSSLRRLAVHTNLNDVRQVVVLRFMLISCQLLQEVVVKNGKATVYGENDQHQHRLLPYSLPEFWRRLDYGEGLKNFCENIRKVSLIGCTGEELELGFLAFLVSNAVAFRGLAVRCCGGCRPSARTATMTLLSTTKRASTGVVITLDGQEVHPTVQAKARSKFLSF